MQKKRFSHRTVILTEKITGEEEIPQHVTAILTPDTTDIVSHVAIRARNGRVLLATCYDTEILQTLRDLKGRWLSVQTTADGDVVFAESSKEEESPVRYPSVGRATVHRGSKPGSATVIGRTSRDAPTDWEAMCEAVFFESGRPVLLAAPESPE